MIEIYEMKLIFKAFQFFFYFLSVLFYSFFLSKNHSILCSILFDADAVGVVIPTIWYCWYLYCTVYSSRNCLFIEFLNLFFPDGIPIPFALLLIYHRQLPIAGTVSFWLRQNEGVWGDIYIYMCELEKDERAKSHENHCEMLANASQLYIFIFHSTCRISLFVLLFAWLCVCVRK